jgi:adenosylhomocysteinase
MDHASSSLPCFSQLLKQYPCDSTTLVLVAHMMDTSIPFVLGLAETLDVHLVIPIPYSVTEGARDVIAARVPVASVSALDALPAKLLSAVQAACSCKQNVVLQDVGGYAAGHINKLAEESSLAGVVEDTFQGHWRYAEQAIVRCPVLSIANSPLKALENRQVGRSLAFSLESLLRQYFWKPLNETNILLLGYGGIGRPTAVSLRERGARVCVNDIDPIRKAELVVDGFSTPNRAAAFRQADVVLGVSGQQSITSEDFEQLSDGAILASGSSKQVEIDVNWLLGEAKMLSNDGIVQQVALRGKIVNLLNSGMPINFLHQSVMGEVLDLIYSELYMCVRRVSRGEAPPGMGGLPSAIQRKIAEVWCSKHAVV